MLGLGQSPVFSAGTQHGFQALAQALLIALKLGDQPPTIFQFIRCRQLCKTHRQLELVLFERLSLRANILQLPRLLLMARQQNAHLPDTPPTSSNTRSPQQ